MHLLEMVIATVRRYWIFIRGLWIGCANETQEDGVPAISGDDVLGAFRILESARTLKDLFGEGWAEGIPA